MCDFIGTDIVAVVIDDDIENSRVALKWAADHILVPGHIFYLLHVRRKVGTIPTHGDSHLSINEVDDDVTSTIFDQHDSQTKEFFLPFKFFCSRKALQYKEVILDGTDVPKTIINFIQRHSIDKLVMGACSRSAIVSSDVPTAVCNAAPDYCYIYVISKGKISSFRPATLKNSTHPNTSYSYGFNPAQNHKGHGCMNEKTTRENLNGISFSSQGPDHSISATIPTSQLTMRRSQALIGKLIGTDIAAVVIDDDIENSRVALKWAADHILVPGHIFYLLHVRRKVGTVPTHGDSHLSTNEVDDDVTSTILDQHDSQTKEFFLPFKFFCSRKALQYKEVILDGTDVPKTIINFIQRHSIDKLVMGACSRSAIVRMLNSSDVPTAVCNAAPDYCYIYVISKGKISSFRPATLKNSTHPNTSYSYGFNPAQNHKGHGCMNEKTRNGCWRIIFLSCLLCLFLYLIFVSR